MGPSPMRAIVVPRASPPALELAERPLPGMVSSQCLVRVRASSVNPVDWKLFGGRTRFLLWPLLPQIPGFDICGVVEATGAGVERFRPGDWVYARLDSRLGGAYAEYAVVGEAAAARQPEALSPEEAAAVPLAALTALQALRIRAQPRPGERVLVLGASGGVGHFAVQIARTMGAEVDGVCGSDHVEMVRGLGAARVIDYRKEDPLAIGERYRVVFDAVGKGPAGGYARLLEPGGTYVTTLPSVGSIVEAMRLVVTSRRRVRHILTKPSGRDLEEIGRWIDEGKVRPVVDRRYSLAQAAEAWRYSREGHAGGKIVIRVD
jgi:NADPH:quinone reductase-like Zn-dependent oxidoreductase